MELIPEVHLEEWDVNNLEECVTYTKGKLRIVETINNKFLQILSTENVFFTVKKINNYWELRSYDTFINESTTSDEDNVEYQSEFMMYIRDLFANCEYLILNKSTGHIYGMNNLFSSSGWSDEILENMWSRDEIEIINLLDDVNPSVFTKGGWEPVQIKNPTGNIEDNRETNIRELI